MDKCALFCCKILHLTKFYTFLTNMRCEPGLRLELQYLQYLYLILQYWERADIAISVQEQIYCNTWSRRSSSLPMAGEGTPHLSPFPVHFCKISNHFCHYFCQLLSDHQVDSSLATKWILLVIRSPRLCATVPWDHQVDSIVISVFWLTLTNTES